MKAKSTMTHLTKWQRALREKWLKIGEEPPENPNILSSKKYDLLIQDDEFYRVFGEEVDESREDAETDCGYNEDE